MSVDRRRLANNAPQKPLTPRLAASPAPPRNTPAPKLAGYVSPSTAASATRRPLSTNTSEVNITARPAESEQVVAKGSASNVTPRSSARKSRADSTQITPTRPLDESPIALRPASTAGVANVGRSRLPLSEEKPTPDQNRLSSPASFAHRVQQGQGYPLSPLGAGSTVSEQLTSSDDKDSYFFRANDGPKETKAVRPLLHKPGGSFVYANGLEEQMGSPAPASQTVSPLPSRPVSFARSDSAPPPDSSPSSATAPLNLSSRTTLSPSATAVSNGLRAASPPRQGFHLSYRKGVSQIMRPSPLAPSVQGAAEGRRRQSSIDGIEDERRPRRAMSISSTDSTAPEKRENGLALLHAFHVPSNRPSPAVSPTGPIQEDDEDGEAYAAANTLQSPPDTADSTEGHGLNDTAASARRERKILDLQISNSSLLAINKSLEKEVRKQKTELRRYRRMSRMATRESLISQASEISDANLLDSDSVDKDAAHGLAADELPDADYYDDDDTESDELDDDPTSPGAISQRDARHRKSDQRRLVADLVKHKELLADSQRMNQSILKCLSVTEQLIKDGARALEYTVPLDEVRLGGRVLSPEEQEDANADADADADASYFSERAAPLDADAARAQRQTGLLQDVLDSTDSLHAAAAAASIAETGS